jgi:hypothetical protein
MSSILTAAGCSAFSVVLVLLLILYFGEPV